MTKKNNKHLVIDVAEIPTAIPIDSLKILLSGEYMDQFRVIKKQIKTEIVVLVIKHRKSNETVKLNIPRNFLDFHKIFYKEAILPTNKQIEGVLEERVRAWDCEFIVDIPQVQFNLVVLRCKESNKTIGCKVPIQDIQKTKLYIEKHISEKDAIEQIDRIHIWRDTEWRRELKVRTDLSKLTRTTNQLMH